LESIPNKGYGPRTFVSLTNVSYAAKVKTTFKDKSVHLPTPVHVEGSILRSYPIISYSYPKELPRSSITSRKEVLVDLTTVKMSLAIEDSKSEYNKLLIPKFNNSSRDRYHIWRKRVECALKARGYWKLVTGEENPPVYFSNIHNPAYSHTGGDPFLPSVEDGEDPPPPEQVPPTIPNPESPYE
jgi:hypothetical protein